MLKMLPWAKAPGRIFTVAFINRSTVVEIITILIGGYPNKDSVD